jgi:hypothetical protein
VQFDESALQNAKAVTKWRDAFGNGDTFSTVTTLTGNFASFVSLGDQATMNPWTFNPSTDTMNLWSVGGFSFHLLSSTIVSQTASFLNIKGTGTVSGNGFDDTAAKWAFTIPFAGGTGAFFSFAANTDTTVPDGGSAVALLGISLVAIEFVRRKLRFRA